MRSHGSVLFQGQTGSDLEGGRACDGRTSKQARPAGDVAGLRDGCLCPHQSGAHPGCPHADRKQTTSQPHRCDPFPRLKQEFGGLSLVTWIVLNVATNPTRMWVDVLESQRYDIPRRQPPRCQPREPLALAIGKVSALGEA